MSRRDRSKGKDDKDAGAAFLKQDVSFITME